MAYLVPESEKQITHHRFCTPARVVSSANERLKARCGESAYNGLQLHNKFRADKRKNIFQELMKCLGEPKVEGSASFVAVHRTADGKESVLGVIEYALLSAATRGRWVYVEGVEVEDAEWQSKGLETEILKRLLAYIKQAKPRVLGAFVLVQPYSREEGVFKSVGFRRTGESNPFEVYAFVITSLAAAKLPTGVPPIDMRLPVTNDGDQKFDPRDFDVGACR
ncbi:hypothetical protein FOZ63_015531 [Perkinsus olseni]|uniref:Uncharacterized protein n=1 Tax=Perkinsus olseni TaxID=32597 RepID=A0A7J6SXL1_PEROL|nr:hypothetical protein FOZ63_015531 [Perkinsus olseni]KAF4745353.1 hypothetical protein FOZ62_015664 [Perkinsus olseni]